MTRRLTVINPTDHAASYLGYIMGLTADDVLRGPPTHPGYATPESREEWRYIQCAQRLAWFHGGAKAASILAGSDPETNADLAKWRALGQPKRGAA